MKGKAEAVISAPSLEVSLRTPTRMLILPSLLGAGQGYRHDWSMVCFWMTLDSQFPTAGLSFSYLPLGGYLQILLLATVSMLIVPPHWKRFMETTGEQELSVPLMTGELRLRWKTQNYIRFIREVL
jgi:hypothetical protein